MFQLIDRKGWNCPAEVEVEHHLVNNFSDELMRAGVVFPFVRWCNPGNSQEKRAEHFHRTKKYGIEKRTQVGIGRWYAALEVNRPRIEKVYDEKNNTYKQATYSFDQLVADDISAIGQYNNMLHPNQKMYPGLTRWEVLCNNQNPNLTPINKALLYRFIGEKTRTSIARNMYCKVRGDKYILPQPELIDRLTPRDNSVQAYYLPDNEGNVSEVYVYQDDNFIATCTRLDPYNEAKAETTERDVHSYEEQSKYVSQFDSMIKKEAIAKVSILPRGVPDDDAEVIELSPPAATSELEEYSFDLDYASMAKDDL